MEDMDYERGDFLAPPLKKSNEGQVYEIQSERKRDTT